MSLPRRTSASASSFRSCFGHGGVFVAALDLRVIAVPLAHVILRLDQSLPLHGKIAHAGRGHLFAAAIDSLGILSARELDRPGCIGKKHGVARSAVLVLDDDRLPADHVGRSMQQERRGHAAGKRAVDGFVLIIERVFHHHVRRDRAGGFVDIVIERDVGVTIDDAGR